MTDSTLKSLGIGLSQLLRYSYGGFLLILFAALASHDRTKELVDAISWELTALSAVVLGAGIYSVHRAVVVPVHHLGLCGILRLSEALNGVDGVDSRSPTRWLQHTLNVKRGWRILSYTAIRRSAIFDETQQEKWNLAHAEAGLVLMTAEGFLLAALYACRFPFPLGPLPLAIIGIALLALSYAPGFAQHRVECMQFRAKEAEIGDLLNNLGIPRSPPPSSPAS